MMKRRHLGIFVCSISIHSLGMAYGAIKTLPTHWMLFSNTKLDSLKILFYDIL